MAERLRLRPGQRVAVIGVGGGLGVHVLQMIRAFGGVAIAIEGDRRKADEIKRREMADAVLVPEDENWAPRVRDLTGNNTAGVVDTVASSATLTEGFHQESRQYVGNREERCGHPRWSRAEDAAVGHVFCATAVSGPVTHRPHIVPVEITRPCPARSRPARCCWFSPVRLRDLAEGSAPPASAAPAGSSSR
jgi:hypothetical protein